jgi:SAM-dependent methyltransferase
MTVRRAAAVCKTTWFARLARLRLPLLAAAALMVTLGCDPGSRMMATYMGTPSPVARAMLDLAKTGPNDVVYDLGSGDGRIVIMAAKNFGARGVGIDIDPKLVALARENARLAGVEDKVRFIQADIFQADISAATVVTLYLYDTVNLRLRPKLLTDLAPGTRVVSHEWGMGDWKPETQRSVDDTRIYLWRIPPRAAQAASAQ